MAPVSKDLRDERAAQLKTMTPAQRRSQVVAWGNEHTQGKTPSGPSANYKPPPPAKKAGTGVGTMGLGKKKPLANLKSKGKPAVIPGTSQGGFSGRKDPWLQAIENLIKYRDAPPKKAWKPPQASSLPPVDVYTPADPIIPPMVPYIPGVPDWQTQGNYDPFGTPGYLSSSINPTGVGFANVAPGQPSAYEQFVMKKYGPGGVR